MYDARWVLAISGGSLCKVHDCLTTVLHLKLRIILNVTVIGKRERLGPVPVLCRRLSSWPCASACLAQRKPVIVKWQESYISSWYFRVRISSGIKKMWTAPLQCQPFKFYIITISSKKSKSWIVFLPSNRSRPLFLLSVPLLHLPSSHRRFFFLFTLQPGFSLEAPPAH